MYICTYWVLLYLKFDHIKKNYLFLNTLTLKVIGNDSELSLL